MANPRYSKPPGCAGCALADVGWGFAPAVGPISSRLLFVGEALGGEEAIAGEPFYGAAGGVLSRLLIRSGIDRKHVRIANVVSCRPPQDWLDGSPWEVVAIQWCRQYLQPILDALPSDAVVVTLGGTALKAVLGLHGVPGITVKDFHGTVHRDLTNRYWVVPTFHPSFLQRGAMSYLDVVTQDIILAEKISREGFHRSPCELIIDPPAEYYGLWVDGHLQRAADDPDGMGLSLDTEFEGKSDDESEVHVEGQVRLTRINVANDKERGITVPYVGEYIRHTERLLAGLSAIRAIIWLWNKYADVEPLAAAGHTIGQSEWLDLMWLWHHIQSDLPRGLGFVAPMASDYGAWKHKSKVKALQGEYAAADGVQNWRVGAWLIRAAHQLGMLDLFMRDWHERDRYVLRPAHEGGVPINRPVLEEYHLELQRKLARVLERMKVTAAAGVLKPKLGYSKRPKGAPCASCQGAGVVWADEGMTISDDCAICAGTGYGAPLPPASIMGKSKTGGAEAKTAYMAEGVILVERSISVEVNICDTCGAEDVGAKHRCPKPKVRKKGRRAAGEHGEVAADGAAPGRADADGGGDSAGAPGPRIAVLRPVQVLRPRWFWQLPFNPDAAAQILAYIESRGIAAPLNRKTQKKTTSKDALKKLAKDHADDPFFQLQLDWKAVQKVDATYAVGTLRRLDADDRVHPEYLPKPSTLRDSAIDPNLTNVVADKSGPESLAAGFRKCVEARAGLPPGVTVVDLIDWETRWTQPSPSTS